MITKDLIKILQIADPEGELEVKLDGDNPIINVVCQQHWKTRKLVLEIRTGFYD